MSASPTLGSRARRWTRALLDPVVSVPLADQRRRVRLLAMFSLVSTALTALGGLEMALVASPETSGVVLPILVAATLGYAGAYGLARRARVVSAANTFVLTQLSANLMVAWCLPPDELDVSSSAAWLTISILGASALGGRREVLAVASATALGLAAVMTHHHTPFPVAMGVLLFLGGFTGVDLAYLEHRNRLETDRQEQLRARNTELEDLKSTLEKRVVERTRELERSTRALEGLQATLEQRVVERTEQLGRRTRELEDAQRAVAQHEATEREHEVAARVATAEQQQLQRAVDARTQFVARMSHELRTPLNAIVGFADLLGCSGLTEAQRAYVTGARASSRHMLELINDLLDQAKMESGRLELETGPFALAPSVREAVALLDHLALDKGLAVSVDVASDAPRWVSGDALRFRQVIVNLVGNALKFTTKGGVRVRVRSRDGGSGVAIDVEDDGPGIAAERQARIFDAYRQADATVARQHGGTGLGLAISRQLARAMGGDLTVSSTIGVGTTFHFVAPLPTIEAVAPVDRTSALSSPPARMRPLRVLLADDDATNRLVGRKLLEVLGHSVDVVSDGEAAVTAAMGGTYDLLIMDVEMPKLDGLGAARALRVAGFGPPILGFTAHATKSHGILCREAGMNGVVHKPMDLGRLTVAIDDVMGAAASQAPRGSDVDLALLDHRVGGDRALYREVLSAIVTETDRLSVELRIASDARELTTLQRIAHTLRGCVANVGARELASALGNLEAAAHARDASRSSSLATDALRAIETMRVELVQALSAEGMPAGA